MRRRGKLALAIVTGGVGLGALLGAVADPEPKQSPEPPWRGAIAAPAYAAPADIAPPEPLLYPDSYAPSWAHEEVTDWEPDYPPWSFGVAAAAPPDEPPVEAEPGGPPPSPAPEPLPPEPQVAGALDALY